uniref:Protein kinase domain-containing protein n=1 Tax=Oreochromis aureus TaxID=47969 RepID=A0A668SWI6_OREAU
IETCDPPTDGRDVTLTDIEQCYEFGRVVGDGNFAVVRECRRRDNGQTLAIKIVERAKLIGREHMMQNELSLLGSLRHPRIVRLFAHHHTNTHSYLVMELVSGGDLFEAISDRGKFSEAEAGLMVSDVSEALNYIHCKSIVHRDLKPENLLVKQVAAGICRLKLGDFGLAMVVTEPVFTICGTPTYVAPEILFVLVFCLSGYGVAVDVWALGVILYILVCGFPPFRSRDRDQVELFQLIKQAQLNFPSPYWDPISEEARGLIRALLQPDPTVRLTAEQTLLHPWVKAMASTCKQRALTDKTPRDIETTGGKPETIQKAAKTNTTESLTDKTRKHAINEEIALKELGRQDERQTAMSSRRGQDKNKPAEQQLVEASHLSPQDREHTPSEASTGQHKPEAASTDRRETQCPSPKLLNSKFNHLDSPSEAETELLPQIKTQAKLTRMQTPTGSTPPTNPSSTPTSSLHQQNLTSAPQNHNKPDAHATTIAHPPTLS